VGNSFLSVETSGTIRGFKAFSARLDMFDDFLHDVRLEKKGAVDVWRRIVAKT